MKRFMAHVALVGVWLALGSAAAADRSFSVFDNGLRDIPSLEEQANLLKKLGYDGICTRPGDHTAQLLAAFDEHGIGVLQTYVTLSAKDIDIPASVVKHFDLLQGRGTVVWLMLLDTEASDEEAVAIIRKVYDAAAARGLPVVLYPHHGCRTATAVECDRLRRLADRPGLGISFNLCHFLRQHRDDMLEETVQAIAPHLKLVQISGANRVPPEQATWDDLIKPLGEGDFDIGRLFRVLEEVGYTGPFNLQCYRVHPPARKHLTVSMNTWRTYHE